MSSRVQKRPAEARFRPSKAGPSRPGQATTISMPSGSQPSNEKNVQETARDTPSINNTNELLSQRENAPATPSKQAGSAIAIPTPISTPSNIGTPRPLPKRVTPGPSSSSNTIRRPSVAPPPSSSTSSFVVNSTPALKSRSTAISTPIGTPGSFRGKSIERPSTLVRSTPTPSFPRSASRPPSIAEPSSSAKGKGVAAAAAPEITSARGATTESQKKTPVRRQSDASTQRKKPPRGSRPTKPASAYSLYSKERRPEVEESAASASGRTFDVNGKIRKDWQALSHEEREPYVEQAEQLQKEYENAMEAFHEIYGRSDDSEEDDAATTSSTKKGQSSKNGSGEPATPKNAYLIFRSEYEQSGKGKKGSGAISTAWHSLSEKERASYRSKAEEAKREWEIAMAQWKQQDNSDGSDEDSEESDGTNTNKRSSKRKAAKRPKKPTLSDDEADYYGSQNDDAAKKKLDNRSATMLELSQLRFNHGRASAKTFELARKHRDEKREKNRLRKKMRLHNVRTEEELTALVGNERRDASNTNGEQDGEDNAQAQQSEHSDAESIVNDGHTSATDGEDGAQSDAESVGAASTSTHHTLREKKFSIRTRIVDGKIVLDESSLQQSRNDDAGYGAQNEMIDINESDRFVNSSSHAKSRPRNDRWNAEETEQFLQAVSMWGSDFEMIARMFPKRDRSQIRSKWRAMERTDSHSLDLAFKRRLPVKLEEYARLAGVDLSGEAPAIELPTFNIKKANEDEEDITIKQGEEEDDEEPISKAEQIQYDENGLEIVDEGDDQDQQNRPPTTRQSKRLARGTPAADMPPPSTNARQTPGEERETLRPKRMRSSSLASQAGTTMSGTTNASNVHGASSAAASDRERKQRRIQEEQRKQRERARRRPRPDDDGVEILEEGD